MASKQPQTCPPNGLKSAAAGPAGKVTAKPPSQPAGTPAPTPWQSSYAPRSPRPSPYSLLRRPPRFVSSFRSLSDRTYRYTLEVSSLPMVAECIGLMGLHRLPSNLPRSFYHEPGSHNDKFIKKLFVGKFNGMDVKGLGYFGLPPRVCAIPFEMSHSSYLHHLLIKSGHV